MNDSYGGPEFSYGDTGGGPRRSRRLRWGLPLAVAAIAGAVAGGAGVYAATSGPATMTTAQIARATDPGLVDVVSTLGYQGGSSAGTGLVLTPGGEVLTNNHVIRGATSIKVTDVGNGRTYKATVAGYNASADIAVLRLQGASGLKTVTLGDSSAVKAGDRVVGLGNAGGKGGIPSVAPGTVTALGQSVTASDQAAGTSEQLAGLIGTNADIQPGDSGGPLVNSHGQVVGIDTAGASGIQLTSRTGGTQAFAIPINRASAIASQIEAGRRSATVHIGTTAFLGVAVRSSGDGGVGVAGVVPSSPAAAAGLHAGDQITAIGGRSVTSPTGVQDALAAHHPGDRVGVSWLSQAGQPHTATVTLTTGPAA